MTFTLQLCVGNGIQMVAKTAEWWLGATTVGRTLKQLDSHKTIMHDTNPFPNLGNSKDKDKVKTDNNAVSVLTVTSKFSIVYTHVYVYVKHIMLVECR